MEQERDPMGHLYRMLGAKKNEEHKRLQKENEQLRDFIESWYDTVKDLCDSCDDTSYEQYLEDYEEIVGR